MIRGLYLGSLQALSLEGNDYVLIPGNPVELPDCEYTRTLVATGMFVPENKPKAAPKSNPKGE
jgi:hypothetical protein